MIKKQYITLSLLVTLVAACGHKTPKAVKNDKGDELFVNELKLRTTPVKNQGRSRLCWMYAMLATIETDRLMIGDSVNLSAAYLERCLLQDMGDRIYMSRGNGDTNMGGVASMTLSLIDDNGIMPYDSYWLNKDINHNVLARKIKKCAAENSSRRSGIGKCREKISDLLDDELGALPYHFYMLSMEYSPKQFGTSVCKSGAYESLTSFTHHPFGERFTLEVPDNTMRCDMLNVPIDSLISSIENALCNGNAVCWEGDISEPGFSFAQGTATLPEGTDVSQKARQQCFERYLTTDDHCMEIMGMARDNSGKRYFIAKNSWGKGNRYKGYMYLSFDYVRLKTVAVYMLKKRPFEALAYETEPTASPYRSTRSSR